ncbi:MAG: hypothetical protein JXA20_09170 [Spirochaetes bacterium]|nr:hypothetical protein [Spirochaetota bacterium]
MPLISLGFFARGFIAIGFSGVGVITIAQFGIGFISLTQFGIGFFALAQFAAGYFTVGQFSLGVIAALGAKAVGFVAMGASPSGYYTLGGVGISDLPAALMLAGDQVRANPFPFRIWSAAWGALAAFVFLRRRVIAYPMSLMDFLRPLLRHSNAVVRLRATGSLDDQHRLAGIVREDPTERVRVKALGMIADQALLREIAGTGYGATERRLAVERIDDEGFLASMALKEKNPKVAEAIMERVGDEDLLMEIAEGAAFMNVRFMALKKMKQPDRSHIEAMARGADDVQLFHILSDFLDDAVLMDIAMTSPCMPVAEAAVARIRNPDQDFLCRLAMESSRWQVADDAVNRITDQDIIERIIQTGAHPGARIAALHRCERKGLIVEASRSDADGEVRRAAKKRLGEIHPLYYSLKLEIRCPHCSQPVFVNGAVATLKCGSCLSAITLADRFWKAVAGAPLGISQSQSLMGLVAEKGLREPVCRECGEGLETDDVASGSDGEIRCGRCGTAHRSMPLPRWLAWSKHAEQLFCVEREGDESEDARRRLQTTTVAVSCIKCGAPLEITPETPRNAFCTYCNTLQYLPDPLWLSIHPVKIKRPWYIRCNYRERGRLPSLK